LDLPLSALVKTVLEYFETSEHRLYFHLSFLTFNCEQHAREKCKEENANFHTRRLAQLSLQQQRKTKALKSYFD
jgi:hypothetical protein